MTVVSAISPSSGLEMFLENEKLNNNIHESQTIKGKMKEINERDMFGVGFLLS